MDTNIKVVLRVRPMNERELGQNNRTVIEGIDENRLVFDPKEKLQSQEKVLQQPSKKHLKRANKNLKFVFDSVCGPNTTNKDVFESATNDMVATLMEGYNCSVFVYGATGAGKTFTMMGTTEQPGITHLMMGHLFQAINRFQRNREFVIAVSYIEVYNEHVFDLLKPSSTPLQLRDSNQCGVTVAGLSIHNVQTAQELLDKLEFGNCNRTQYPTDANAESSYSSYSHAVFQVHVTMKYKVSGQCFMTKLSMVDLAGERPSANLGPGGRFKKGANINCSLLALRNCINKLADGNAFIPYRDSKLTQAIKDCLGGNCKTVLIANISPSSMCYEDTYNTLKYAARAKKIQVRLKNNIVDVSPCVTVAKELKWRLDQDKRNDTQVKVEEKIAELELLPFSTNTVTVGNSNVLAKRAFWSERINEAELVHEALESKLLAQMSHVRVLALRHFLRTRAFEHVADLAHRSSCDELEEICTEEIPRRERPSVNYATKIVRRNLKIIDARKKTEESGKTLHNLMEECLADCPYLTDTVERVKMQGKHRKCQAINDLNHKLCTMMINEIIVSDEWMGDAFSMLKKMYLTIKRHSLVPPSLTAEYVAILCKLKSAKNISWSDENIKRDILLTIISTLDLENPTLPYVDGDEKNKNTTIDDLTDSDDLTDIENRATCSKNLKLHNNDTIIINDSLEALDAKSINSAKSIKMETTKGFENLNNFDALDPADLNTSFELLTGEIDIYNKYNNDVVALAKHAIWSKRINEVELVHEALESKLLALMSQKRVLALRHFLRTRAFKHVADLAHPSSCDALKQICTEEIPRRERASVKYAKEIVRWNLKIIDAKKKREDSYKTLHYLMEECLADCPYLTDTVERVKMQGKHRKCQAINDLNHKLCTLLMNEITVSVECIGDAFSMLRKLYLILKGLGDVSPVLTAEYAGILLMSKLKSAKDISWSDENIKRDEVLMLISPLDLENHEEDKSTTIDVITNSDDPTDIENRAPCTEERKGTPIELHSNDSFIINDSLEALDTLNINSAKKINMETRNMKLIPRHINFSSPAFGSS